MTVTAKDRTTTSADGECRVAVSRRIEADAATIFEILADPSRHTELDGSEMLRGALTEDVVSGVGDVFVLKMYFVPLGGDYEMANHVVEFDQEPEDRLATATQRHRPTQLGPTLGLRTGARRGEGDRGHRDLRRRPVAGRGQALPRQRADLDRGDDENPRTSRPDGRPFVGAPMTPGRWRCPIGIPRSRRVT